MPELVARLSHVPGIVAVKSPTGNREETAAHVGAPRGLVPSDFLLGYSGDWNSPNTPGESRPLEW